MWRELKLLTYMEDIVAVAQSHWSRLKYCVGRSPQAPGNTTANDKHCDLAACTPNNGSIAAVLRTIIAKHEHTADEGSAPF